MSIAPTRQFVILLLEGNLARLAYCFSQRLCWGPLYLWLNLIPRSSIFQGGPKLSKEKKTPKTVHSITIFQENVHLTLQQEECPQPWGKNSRLCGVRVWVWKSQTLRMFFSQNHKIIQFGSLVRLKKKNQMRSLTRSYKYLYDKNLCLTSDILQFTGPKHGAGFFLRGHEESSSRTNSNSPKKLYVEDLFDLFFWEPKTWNSLVQTHIIKATRFSWNMQCKSWNPEGVFQNSLGHVSPFSWQVLACTSWFSGASSPIQVMAIWAACRPWTPVPSWERTNLKMTSTNCGQSRQYCDCV